MKRLNLLFGSLAMVALVATAGAQTWDETGDGGGDAGNLPSTAQVPTGSGPLTRITGALSASDVDMFAILIVDPANFYAHTGSSQHTTTDVKLHLFDASGRPLWMNDDRPSDVGGDFGIDGYGSYIGGGSAATNYVSSDTPGTDGSATWSLPGPGLYYIAISRWSMNSSGANGQHFHSSAPYNRIKAPYSARANDPVTGWIGSTTTTGTYTIFLNGVNFVPEPASMVALGAGLVGLLGLRRRKK